MPAVRYLVRDTDRAVHFYTEQLGFEVVERWGPAFAILRQEGLELWLSGPQTSAAQPMPDGRVPEPGGWNRIVVGTHDIATVVERLKRSGATFRNEILSGPGGSQVLLEDGEGNVIELFEQRGE